MTDKTGRPKGYVAHFHLYLLCEPILTSNLVTVLRFAYIEFAHIDSVARALELTDTVLKSRKITVTQKRTNVPGMKRGGGAAGGNFRGGFVGYMPMAYGMMPVRGRGGPARGHSNRGRGRTNPY